MNGHQKYVDNLITKYTPAQVAALVGVKRGNASKDKSVEDLHAMVKDFATPETKVKWVNKIAEAVSVNSAPDWRDGWELLLIDLLRDLDEVPDEAEVHHLDQRAA